MPDSPYPRVTSVLEPEFHATAAPGLLGWIREGTPAARRSLLAASLGWMLDGFDIMLYALVVSALLADLAISTLRGCSGRSHSWLPESAESCLA